MAMDVVYVNGEEIKEETVVNAVRDWEGRPKHGFVMRRAEEWEVDVGDEMVLVLTRK